MGVLLRTASSRWCLSAAGSEIFKINGNDKIQTDKSCSPRKVFQVIGRKVLGCGVLTTSLRIIDTELGQNQLKLLGENPKLLEGFSSNDPC